VFHSALEAAGISPNGEDGRHAPIDVDGLTLSRSLDASTPREELVFAEAYTPDTLLALMENEDPAAIETFRCRSMRRAVYEGRHKLITVDDEPDELFDVIADPGERYNLLADHPRQVARLRSALRGFVNDAAARRPEQWEASRNSSLDDALISQRLRSLGYLE
jgi:hypothetical protein